MSLTYEKFAPALAVLRSGPLTHDARRRNDTLPTTLDVALDAIACLCVTQPGDQFAVSIFTDPASKPALLLASNCESVPDTVMTRIKGIWDYLYDQASGEDADTVFLEQQYLLSWPVFQYRVLSVDRAIQVLEEVVSSNGQLPEERLYYPTALRDVEVPVDRLQSIINRLRSLDWVIQKTRPTRDDVTRVHNTIALLNQDFRNTTKIVIDIAAAVGETFQVDIQNMLRLDEGIKVLIAYRKTEKLDDLVATEVRLILPQMGHYDFQPDSPDLKVHIGRKLYQSYTRELPEYIEDYNAHLLPALKKLHDDISQSYIRTDAGFLVPTHPECTLLAFVLKASKDARASYIGTSQKSCLLCYRFISSCADCDSRLPRVRGSHGLVQLPWIKPVLSGPLETRIEAYFENYFQGDDNILTSAYAWNFHERYKVKPDPWDTF